MWLVAICDTGAGLAIDCCVFYFVLYESVCDKIVAWIVAPACALCRE